MNSLELFRLSRRLLKLGVRSIPSPGFRELPTSVRMVLLDVLENPDTTISHIVERTGFPQSHVSSSVARLRDSGVLITAVDPVDRRRTLVAPSAAHLERVEITERELGPIDAVVEAALVEAGTFSPDHLKEAKLALESLARLLTPSNSSVTARAQQSSGKGLRSC